MSSGVESFYRRTPNLRGVDEFEFEVTLCATLEATGKLVSRQLGTGIIHPGNRITDIITITTTDAFDNRTQITPEEIPEPAIKATVGPGRFQYWKDAYRELDIHPERAKSSMERAIDIGFFEAERRNGRTYIRQTTRYPDWIDTIQAIENKPNLSRPGALQTQLKHDVALGVVDEVILATRSHVTRAHLNRLPDKVGVWEYRNGTITVVREPTQLPVTTSGIERLTQHPGRTDIEIVTRYQKAQKRQQLGERAYGKGWRTYELCDCSHITTQPLHQHIEGNQVTTERKSGGRSVKGLPFCTQYAAIIDPGTTCGKDCPHYQSTESPISTEFDTYREKTSPWTKNTRSLTRSQSHLDAFSPDQ